MVRTLPLVPLVSFALVSALLTGIAAQAQAPKQKTPSAGGNTGKSTPKTPSSTTGGVNLGTMQVGPPPGLALFNQALAATNAGKYDEAERLYRQLLTTEPDAAAAWANLGLLLGRRGQVAEATRCLERATQLSPETGAFWAQLSSFQLRGNKGKAAEASARKALSREPKNALALANLGDLLIQQRRYKEAVPILRRLRETPTYRTDDRAEISLILALENTGQRTEALTLARKRVTRNPRDPNAYLLLGDAARAAGQLDEAKQSYTEAAALDPKNQGAMNGLAVVQAMQGNRDVAVRLLAQQIARTPNDPRLHFQLGSLYYGDTRLKEEERFRKSEAEFRRAALLDPKNPTYVINTGIAIMMQGTDRLEEAQRYLEGGLYLDPKAPMPRLALAHIAEMQGKAADAAAQYRTLLTANPNNRDARRGLAGVLYAAGKRTEAYAEMEEIARRNPKDTTVLSELASWQVDNKEMAAAHRTYERVLARDPKDPGSHFALGQMAERENQPDAARSHYEAALTASPKNGQVALVLGSMLTTQHKPDEAMAVYRRLLDADPANNVVHWQLALALRDQKRYDESLAEMQVITLVKGDPNRVLYMLGAPRLLIDQKRYEEAIGQLQRLRQEYPKEDEIRYTLAEAYEKAGALPEAEKILTELAARPTEKQTPDMPPSARPALALAGLYERAGKLDEAAGSFEDALRTEPMNMVALQGLSRVRQQQKKPEAAAAFVEELALSDPTAPYLPAVGAVHQLCLQDKTFDKYLAFTKRLLDKYPEVRDARYIRARALTEETPEHKPSAAERTEAVDLYQKVVTRNANDVIAQSQLAQQLEALGKKEEAIVAYKAMLKISPLNTEAQTALHRLGATATPAPPPPPAADGKSGGR